MLLPSFPSVQRPRDIRSRSRTMPLPLNTLFYRTHPEHTLVMLIGPPYDGPVAPFTAVWKMICSAKTSRRNKKYQTIRGETQQLWSVPFMLLCERCSRRFFVFARQRRVTPLHPEDAGLIAGCCSLPSGGAPPGEDGVGGAESMVRGLIQRNPSAGIRRGNQLVAW